MSLQIPQRVLDRIWSKVDVRGSDECWPYQGCVRPDGGYGVIGWWEDGRGRTTHAHRVAWVAVHGPIPNDLTIDHDRRLCPGGNCSNPAHLRLLTRGENAIDGIARRPRKTHCPHGHAYTVDNTYINPRGRRECRRCKRQRLRINRKEVVL